jgi:hypothetical protein
MWGDVPWLAGLLRVHIKLIVALVVALVLHEGFAAWRLSVSTADAEKLVTTFSQISDDPHGLAGTKAPKDAGYDRVAFCLEVNPATGIGCKNTKDDTRLNEAGVASGLGYKILGVSGEAEQMLTSGAFFRVRKHLGLISEGHIEESIDTLLRRLELALFNGPKANASDVKLCTGTRTLLNGSQCRITGRVGYLVGAETAELLTPKAEAVRPTAEPVATPAAAELVRDTRLIEIIGELRIASMFIGPIQFGALAIFCYALLETLGLWLRWVAPGDRLQFALDPAAVAETVGQLRNARVLSISDRMMIAAMRVVKRTKEEPPSVPARGDAISVPPGGPVAELTPDGEFVEVLSSYRDYLHEEAAGRQDALEMLGDTMLKLAFLGTVYGISAALFSARGLDTSDPILRLSTKAAMYAGIGLGFGTTILGIALSIVAAIFRTNLAASWSNEIGAAYQRIFKAGSDRVAIVVTDTREEDLGILDKAAPRKDRITPVQLLGLIVVVALLAAAAFVYREQIADLFSVIRKLLGENNVG